MAMIDINWNPSRRELKQFAGLLAVFGPAVGAWLWWSRDATDGAAIATAVGLALGAVGYALPALIRPLYVGWMIAVFPIGWTISHAILALIYFGVVTPIGLVMRLVRRDPMQRSYDPDAPSYWSERKPAPPVERYFRQF